MSLSFEILSHAGQARLGRLQTPHGTIATPAFMPVGTLGAVKGVTPQELGAAGASVMLANLYHLVLRPGIDVVERLGGLHRFTGWSGPLLTDSGGFQVWSLGALRSLDEGGVTFRSHIDGSTWRFTPELVVAWQRRLGVDIAMVLDECVPWPITEELAAAAWQRTLRWAARAREAWAADAAAAAVGVGIGNGAGATVGGAGVAPSGGTGAAPGVGGLFGIVQGSSFRGLRERAAAELTELDFDGYAIGGVSVGEPAADRRAVVEWTAPALPADRPRYLMGVGYPEDIVHAVAQGVDLFDCVLPARNARHGVLFTRAGALKIRHARFRDDPLPVDPECGCPCCSRVSRAFLHHLMRTGELTGPVLATLHNLRYYLDFMVEVRQAIELGALADLAARLGTRLGIPAVGAGIGVPDPPDAEVTDPEGPHE